MKPHLIAIFTLLLSFTSRSQTPATTEHVRELITATGSAKVGVQLMNNMVTSFKTQMPNIPAEFWDEFMKEVNPEELTELVIPIYQNHFTDEEIVSLIEFYKSPIGLKLTRTLPLIAQEAYQAGTEWGTRLAEKAISRLKEKGYSIENHP